MVALNVQFSDSTQETITGYFAGPQDEADYPNQGVVDSSDSRWLAYYENQPIAIRSCLPSPTSV